MGTLDFKALTGRCTKIAVVDSGIVCDHPSVRPVSGGIRFYTDSTGQIASDAHFHDCAGHGTACAGIIRKKAPEVEIYSVRVFDESLSTDGRTLKAAIEWAITHRMDVVNISLGTTDSAFRDQLAVVCGEAAKAGTVLVAAESNEGRISYPAAFHEVIDVTAGKVFGSYGYFYRQEERAGFIARGDEQRLCWLQPSEVVLGGSSFAAPHVSAIVALIRQAYPHASFDEVLEILRANSLEKQPELVLSTVSSPLSSTERTNAGRRGDTTDEQRRYAWIKKAALYPYTKELHGFVRFRDQLTFDVVGIADPIGRGLVGKDAGDAIGIPDVGISISAGLPAALEGADTLILGYVDELSRISKRDFLRESIELALERGLHVFSFRSIKDTDYGDLLCKAQVVGRRIEYPSISGSEVDSVLKQSQDYDPVDVPVLGVFGTSAQQGKFTLQLALRKRLISMGYRVGQIGTEHQSELFGMDLTFPMGYAPAVEMPLDYWVPYLESKMRQICHHRNPDILVVGGQSGTVPYDRDDGNSRYFLPSIAFLLGTKPDACLLVVNSIDPDQYIQDTIDSIRGIGKAPTILLAIGDKEKHIRTAYGRSWVTPRQMSKEEIQGKLQYLESKFGLPAIEITSERDQVKMIETILGYFSKG